MITVLITGCSKHSKAMIDTLRKNYNNESVRAVGVDCNKYNLLKTTVDASYIVPRSDDDAYIPMLLDICKKENVDIVLPFITRELDIMAKNKHVFEKNGIKVSVASHECLNVVNNKMKLYDMFYYYMPWQAVVRNQRSVEAVLDRHKGEKVCCKITDGCGGKGFAILDERLSHNLYMLNSYGIDRYIDKHTLMKCVQSADNGEIMLSRYIDGKDYSLCVLADNGKITHAAGILGHVMSYGSIMNGEIYMNQDALDIARDVALETKLDGNACFDYRIDGNGNVYLLEVNPRLSASLPFIGKAGLNLPYLRCRQLLGDDVSGKQFKINDRLKMEKYYACEYFI